MLKEKILQNLNAALKEKKGLETSVLRMLLAAILNKEKEKRYRIFKETSKGKTENLVKEDESSSSATELSRSGSEGGKGRSVPFDFAAARVSEEEILNNLKKISKNIFLIPATEICQEKLGTNVVAGVYLISLSSFKNLIPMKPSSLFKAIKKIIPEKYLELNLKTFNLASDSEALK